MAPTEKGLRSMRRVLVLAVGGGFAALLGLGGGVAWGYFSGSGSGTGAALAGTASTAAINATPGTAALAPGGSAAVYFTITNPNALAATFSTVTAASVTTDSNPSACPIANLTIAPALPETLGSPITVGAHSTSGTESIANFVTLSGSAPTGCQGVTFHVSLTLPGKTS